MSSETEVRDLLQQLKSYGLQQAELAYMLGVTRRSIVAWSRGTPPRRDRIERLRTLNQLTGELAAKNASLWLRVPNVSFANGATPADLLSKNDFEAVNPVLKDYLKALEDRQLAG